VITVPTCLHSKLGSPTEAEDALPTGVQGIAKDGLELITIAIVLAAALLAVAVLYLTPNHYGPDERVVVIPNETNLAPCTVARLAVEPHVHAEAYEAPTIGVRVLPLSV
jgi:hypothetical protein